MSKKVEGDLPSLILLEDLGLSYSTPNSKQKKRFGIYKCGFCGTEFRTCTYMVTIKHTVSCGCYRKEQARKATSTHGNTKSKLYSTWAKAKARVTNQNTANFMDYGGRGITMCDEWLNSFEKFQEWAYLVGYTEETHKNLSLDRIDVNGNYCPENCRWTTRTIQNRNQTKRRDNNSGYKGVSYHKDRRKYQVRINILGEPIYLGLYQTPEDGAVAYNNYIIANDLEGFPLNKLPDSHIHLQLPTKPHHQTLE